MLLTQWHPSVRRSQVFLTYGKKYTETTTGNPTPHFGFSQKTFCNKRLLHVSKVTCVKHTAVIKANEAETHVCGCVYFFFLSITFFSYCYAGCPTSNNAYLDDVIDIKNKSTPILPFFKMDLPLRNY